MGNYRSIFADLITIFTGLFTLVSGFLVVSTPASELQVSEWNEHLISAMTITVAFFTFCFFICLSINGAKKINSFKQSGLPNWLVNIFCHVGGFLLFYLFQTVIQFKLFPTSQEIYLFIPLCSWLIIGFALMSQFMNEYTKSDG